jgi:hypothetical protein
MAGSTASYARRTLGKFAGKYLSLFSSMRGIDRQKVVFGCGHSFIGAKLRWHCMNKSIEKTESLIGKTERVYRKD